MSAAREPRSRSSMHKPVRKAVFPVAGLGTRIPAGDQGDAEGDADGRRQAADPIRGRGGARRPASRSSISSPAAPRPRSRTISTSPTSSRRRCASAARSELLDELTPGCPRPARSPITRQQRPLGLGHAVWCARHLVGDEPFAVLLADDLMVGEPPCLKQMVDAYARDRRQHRRGDRGAARADQPLRRARCRRR